MIPILYAQTDPAFTSNGMGRLAEATSCTVTEVRNGEYELELTYPITGKLYNYIQEGRIVAATHDDQGDRQRFIIYRRSAPINGLVTFYAHHISYKLNDIVLDPVTATSAAAAMSLMETQTTPVNPFTMEIDRVVTSGTFKTDIPMSVRAALGGTRGSVLEVFGGEYEWDNMRVILHAHRGESSGITIRYGKNMTDLTQTYDELGTYDAVFPYWYQEGDGLVVIPEKYVVRQGVTNPRIAAVDFTQDFQEKPDPAALKARAESWLSNNRPWVPNENIKIKFIQLWQTEEYKDVAALQRLHLCDRVNVYYPALGIEVDDVEIIKVVYNVLLDRYDEMELGEARSTFGETLIKPVIQEVEGIVQNYPTKSFMQNAIDDATTAITGGAGGVFKFKFNANDQPVEFLILDTGNEATAENVWRWNAAGLGHSPNGYDGPYDDLAILANGDINASRIRTGTMSAEHIKGGTLSMGGTTAEGSYGDGVIQIYDASDRLIFNLDKLGLNHYGYDFADNREERIHIHDAEIDGYARNNGGAWRFASRIANAAVVAGYDGVATDGMMIETVNGHMVIRSSDYIFIDADRIYANDVQVLGATPEVGETDPDTAVRYIYFSPGSGTGQVYIPDQFGFVKYDGSTYLVNVASSSDKRLKKNIKPSTINALEALKRVEYYEFDFIKGDIHKNIGYVAQQLEEIIPSAVFDVPDKMDKDRNPISITKKINDSELLIYATAAIKELNEKVTGLEARIAELEKTKE